MSVCRHISGDFVDSKRPAILGVHVYREWRRHPLVDQARLFHIHVSRNEFSSMGLLTNLQLSYCLKLQAKNYVYADTDCTKLTHFLG